MNGRYGGKYSPDQRASDADKGAEPPPLRPFDGKRRSKTGARTNLLFIMPLPLAIAAFTGGPVQMALSLTALGVMLLAAWLTREGLIAQEAYEARKVARRPALPRKMLGSLLTGAGLFAAGLAHGEGLVGPVIYGILGTVLHSLAFGFDPLRNKGIEGVDTFQQDRVARAVDDAERHLAAMQSAIARTSDRALERRLEQFSATVRRMFRTVEQDPRDLTAARRYLGVYLLGARDATVKFADLHARGRDPQARADYLALLDDLEKNFAARTETFLINDRTDLDIEIGVLRDRLAREGIRPEEQ